MKASASAIFDVIVVGGGVIGSATGHDLAGRGARVLVLEKDKLLHKHGSSHGESRIIRRTYTDPHLASLMPEAYAGWAALQRECELSAFLSRSPGDRLLEQTGGLDWGLEGSRDISNVIKASEALGVPCDDIHNDAVKAKFPFLQPPSTGAGADAETPYKCLFSAQSGILNATRCVAALQHAAHQRGADIVSETRVQSVERCSQCDWAKAGGLPNEPCGLRVLTDHGTFLCRRVVMALGGWAADTAKVSGGGGSGVSGDERRDGGGVGGSDHGVGPGLLEATVGLRLPLKAIRTTVAYWRISDDTSRPVKSPIFIHHGDPYNIYGMSSHERPGCVKVCWHGGKHTDPSHHPPLPCKDEGGLPAELASIVAPFLSQFFRAPLGQAAASSLDERMASEAWLEQLEHAEQCIYTMTPDEGFIVDALPLAQHPADSPKPPACASSLSTKNDIIVGAGFSGHGFKLATVIGSLLAELALVNLPSHSHKVERQALQDRIAPFRLLRPALRRHMDGSKPYNDFSGEWDGDASPYVRRSNL